MRPLARRIMKPPVRERPRSFCSARMVTSVPSPAGSRWISVFELFRTFSKGEPSISCSKT
jgi:hypothetical protein